MTLREIYLSFNLLWNPIWCGCFISMLTRQLEDLYSPKRLMMMGPSCGQRAVATSRFFSPSLLTGPSVNAPCRCRDSGGGMRRNSMTYRTNVWARMGLHIFNVSRYINLSIFTQHVRRYELKLLVFPASKLTPAHPAALPLTTSSFGSRVTASGSSGSVFGFGILILTCNWLNRYWHLADRCY